MKTLFKSIGVLIALVLFNVSILAQVTSGSWYAKAQEDNYVVKFAFTADSAASEFYTVKFTPPADFNSYSFVTYPITATYDLATASGNPAVIIKLYGVGANGQRYVLDSLGIGTGAGDTLVSTTANKCLLDLNAAYTFPTYQIGVAQIDGGKALTASYVELYFKKRKGY